MGGVRTVKWEGFGHWRVKDLDIGGEEGLDIREREGLDIRSGRG